MDAARAPARLALLRIGAGARARVGRTGCGARLILVALERAFDLVLRGARVLLGHRFQILRARELAVMVLVGLLEVLGKRGIALRFTARDVTVSVLVEGFEARIVFVLADLVLGVGAAHGKREHGGNQKEKRLCESHSNLVASF